MQIDLDGTIRFDLYDEMIHTYRIAKNAHSKGTIRDAKGCLLPEIARWIEAPGRPSETLTLIQATTLFPLAVFRAISEHYIDFADEKAARRQELKALGGRPYMDNG